MSKKLHDCHTMGLETRVDFSNESFFRIHRSIEYRIRGIQSPKTQKRDSLASKPGEHNVSKEWLWSVLGQVAADIKQAHPLHTFF